jgi:soluble lytic murein transglycosylase-like protein
LFFPVALRAQDPDPYQAARALQEAAARQQRESVRAQAASRQGQPHTFFTVPFQNPYPPAPVFEQDCEPRTGEELRQIIEEAAQREGVTPDLLRAMIGQESSFRPCAVSPKGAQGLMQLMPATQADLGVTDPFDPKQNIDAGAHRIRQLLDRYRGDLALALGAYNAGPGRIDEWGGLPGFPETRNYVMDLLRKLARN